MAAEANLVKWTLEQIRLRGGRRRKVKWINHRGAPDELVWVPAWSWPELWEMKAPGKPLQEHQKREHKKLAAMGLKCRKIDSREQVLRLLGPVRAI